MRLILFGLLALLAEPSFGATKRALIVGINQYQPRSNQEAHSQWPEEKPLVKRGPVLGRGGTRLWTDLAGPFNDATLIRQNLIDRLGFRPEDIIFLTDEEHAGGDPKKIATAQNILDDFQRHLINAAAPGDVSFFFYAGHGSQIANKKTDEPDGMDETLVSADAAKGVPDIRDKELVRLYRAAVRKGVMLTAVLDSCHSGGTARGVSPKARTRAAPPDTRYVEDAPDRDPTGKPLPDAAAKGALVIAGAQDDQAALEINADGRDYGAFTYYFVRALQTSSVNESVDHLFAKTQAIMLAAGPAQLPSLHSNRERASRGLIGQPADSVRGLVVPLVEVRSNGTVLLRGGKALGLDEGCELVSMKSPKEIRIRVTGSNLTLAQAEATIIGKPGSVSLQAGDEFRLEKWVLPPSAATAFYLPTSGLPALVELQAWGGELIRELEKNGLKVIDEPTVESPDEVLRWVAGRWQLEIRDKASARSLDLGLSPTPAGVIRALGDHPGKLFIDFPPPAELASEIQDAVGEQTAMLLRGRRENTIYQLAGRWKDGSLEYAWVLAGATQEDVKNSPLPDRTRWVNGSGPQAGQVVQQLGARITRVRLWLQMDTPAGLDSFPYEMVLRNTETKADKTGGTTVDGEEYELWFKAKTTSSSGELTPKYIYIASIDRLGKMEPVYPEEGRGTTSENRFPQEEAPPREFPIPMKAAILTQGPFGVDTLIAIISDDPIDMTPLYSEGVRAFDRRDAKPLEQFLMSVQGSRGTGIAVTGFTVQRLTTRSLSKAQAAVEHALQPAGPSQK